MDDKRLELHEKLVAIVPHVYFQPPESVKMVYPCIRYELSNVRVVRANDKPYTYRKAYDLIIISRDPDNEIAKTIIDSFDYARFDRRYIAENLYHDSLTIYW